MGFNARHETVVSVELVERANIKFGSRRVVMDVPTLVS